MPVYYFSESKMAIEAKSENAARIHLTNRQSCKVVGATELADLVISGVKVESANKQAEADEAAMRG